MIEVLPLLWSGGDVEYSGEHLDVPALRMRPAVEDVPILIGGNTKPALRRAAKADGWIAAFTNLDELMSMLAEFDAQRSRQGRSDRPREVLVTATPGIVKQADRLTELGVDGIVIPAVTLAPSSDTAAVVAGLERYAARW